MEASSTKNLRFEGRSRPTPQSDSKGSKGKVEGEEFIAPLQHGSFKRECTMSPSPLDSDDCFDFPMLFRQIAPPSPPASLSRSTTASSSRSTDTITSSGSADTLYSQHEAISGGTIFYRYIRSSTADIHRARTWPLSSMSESTLNIGVSPTPPEASSTIRPPEIYAPAPMAQGTRAIGQGTYTAGSPNIRHPYQPEQSLSGRHDASQNQGSPNQPIYAQPSQNGSPSTIRHEAQTPNSLPMTALAFNLPKDRAVVRDSLEPQEPLLGHKAGTPSKRHMPEAITDQQYKMCYSRPRCFHHPYGLNKTHGQWLTRPLKSFMPSTGGLPLLQGIRPPLEAPKRQKKSHPETSDPEIQVPIATIASQQVDHHQSSLDSYMASVTTGVGDSKAWVDSSNPSIQEQTVPCSVMYNCPIDAIDSYKRERKESRWVINIIVPQNQF